jgi:hypothetical protein
MPEATTGDEHQALAALRKLIGELHRHSTAERMPDDRAALVAEHAEQVANSAGVRTKRVICPRLRGQAMPQEVWGNDRVAFGQWGQYLLPGRRASGDAVDEYQQGAPPGSPIADAVAVQRDLTRFHQPSLRLPRIDDDHIRHLSRSPAFYGRGAPQTALLPNRCRKPRGNPGTPVPTRCLPTFVITASPL